MSEARTKKLTLIAEEINVCTACRLYEGTNKAVPGYGDPSAEILFIGEAPGFYEDQQGLPFVGKSGRYLDYLLTLIGMKREQVFITNVVKHRPPDNRDPQSDEIIACNHFLKRQFEIIDPLVVATLGRFSMAQYFPNGKISSIHGQPKYADDRAYYPLFHPAAALRNPNLRIDMEDDIKRIPDVLEEVKKRRANAKPSADMPEDAKENAQDNGETDEPPQQLRLF
ncbi:MAG: uracil-DNA glycosylase [Aggregatilineales bacterium]